MDLSSIAGFNQLNLSQARDSLSTSRLQDAASRAQRATGREGGPSASSTNPAAGPAGKLESSESLEELEDVATQFESLFVEQMLSSMRDTLNKDARLFDGGMAEEYFEDMLYQEYAATIAKQGDLGIADMIVDQYRSAL
ncbi:MAG: rod-binding protein [Spirochaetota bacterium]